MNWSGSGLLTRSKNSQKPLSLSAVGETFKVLLQTYRVRFTTL